jgi:hypothetical protein
LGVRSPNEHNPSGQYHHHRALAYRIGDSDWAGTVYHRMAGGFLMPSKEQFEDLILTVVLAGLEANTEIEFAESQDLRPITEGQATINVGFVTGENFLINLDIYEAEGQEYDGNVTW